MRFEIREVSSPLKKCFRDEGDRFRFRSRSQNAGEVVLRRVLMTKNWDEIAGSVRNRLFQRAVRQVGLIERDVRRLSRLLGQTVYPTLNRVPSGA